jgi:hypothetical protein
VSIRRPSSVYLISHHLRATILVADGGVHRAGSEASTRQLFSMGGARGGGLRFYGDDVAYVDSEGGYEGLPVEFVRNESGAVKWIRVNGRIARKVPNHK